MIIRHRIALFPRLWTALQRRFAVSWANRQRAASLSKIPDELLRDVLRNPGDLERELAQRNTSKASVDWRRH